MKIDGKQIANIIFEELKAEVKKLHETNINPCLAIIIVGKDPASASYVRQKKIKAKEIGTKTIIKRFFTNVSQNNLLSTIQQFNDDNSVHGIIVQEPLPSHINVRTVTQAINPRKDVDGFLPNSSYNVPIASAVFKILEEVCASTPGVELEGVELELTEWLKSKKIVIIGKGETGGKPIIESFRKIGIMPTIIDSKTSDPARITQTADIIISAVGKKDVIKPEMIKKGVVLIGIGISRGKSAKLAGDYDEDKIKDIASFYTPTPGGMGPINIAMLLKNVIKSSESIY